MSQKMKIKINTMALFFLIACSGNEAQKDSTSSKQQDTEEVDLAELLDEGPTELDLEMAAGYPLGTEEKAVLVTFESLEETDEGVRLTFITELADHLVVQPENLWDPDLGGMTNGWEVDLSYFENDLIDTDFLLVYIERSGENYIHLLAEATPEQIKDLSHGKIICQTPGVKELKK